MLAVLFTILGASILLILPETLHLGKNQTLSSTNDFVQTEVFEDEDGSSVDEGALTISKKNWTILHEKLKESRFVFTQLKLLALPITFLVQSLHGNMNQFLLQLASKRLHWSLVDASFLIPLASITNFVQLVFILPAVYVILARFHLEASAKDLLVSRGSVIFMALGSFGLAFSTVSGLFVLSTVLFSLGIGTYPAVRSLLTDLMHPTPGSRLYGVLAVMDTVGGMISSPLVAATLSLGLKKGGSWSGGVFLVAGTAFAAAGLLTLSISVKIG